MLIFRFAPFCDLNCGTVIDLEFNVAGITAEDATDTLLTIDFEPFEKKYNGFVEPYTRCGCFGFSSAYDIIDDGDDVDGFDILFAFNYHYATLATSKDTVDKLAKYVLKFFKQYSKYDGLTDQKKG